jgi:hypothetical protein
MDFGLFDKTVGRPSPVPSGAARYFRTADNLAIVSARVNSYLLVYEQITGATNTRPRGHPRNPAGTTGRGQAYGAARGTRGNRNQHPAAERLGQVSQIVRLNHGTIAGHPVRFDFRGPSNVEGHPEALERMDWSNGLGALTHLRWSLELTTADVRPVPPT